MIQHTLSFRRRIAAAALLCLPLLPLFAAAEPSPAARHEIEHLLSRLEASGCDFFRNGQWYGGAKAKDHLQQKYDYLLKRDLVARSEDFIRLAATGSSMSGKPYQVRCKGGEPVPSADWLGEELARYREARNARSR